MSEFFSAGVHQRCTEVEIRNNVHVIRCSDCGDEEEFSTLNEGGKARAVQLLSERHCRQT